MIGLSIPALYFPVAVVAFTVCLPFSVLVRTLQVGFLFPMTDDSMSYSNVEPRRFRITWFIAFVSVVMSIHRVSGSCSGAAVT